MARRARLPTMGCDGRRRIAQAGQARVSSRIPANKVSHNGATIRGYWRRRREVMKYSALGEVSKGVGGAWAGGRGRLHSRFARMYVSISDGHGSK